MTALLFTSGDVTDDGPLNTLHVPVPIAGMFPFRFAVVAHTVWLAPAFAMDGFASRCILTVDDELAQTPLLMVH